jgi:hypothetical protein
LDQTSLPFDLTLLTNAARRSGAIVAVRKRAGEAELIRRETGFEWPAGMFSLSHVALPFAPDDPVYGARPPEHPVLLYLGRPELLGEKGLLAVPAADLIRLRFNPFFSFVLQRIREFLEAGEGGASGLPGPAAALLPSGAE